MGLLLDGVGKNPIVTQLIRKDFRQSRSEAILLHERLHVDRLVQMEIHAEKLAAGST